MVKFIVANFNKFFLFFIFFVNISYAYVIDIESLGDSRDYSIKGHFGSADISPGVDTERRGMVIYYALPRKRSYAEYISYGTFCKTKDPDEAVKIINDVLANKHTLKLTANYSYFPESTITLICPAGGTKTWSFQGYVGSPKREGSVSCQITAPLDVDFGIVTVGDDGKVIEKQVAIKCDKATGIWLTLEGDEKSDIQYLGGSKVKLRVGEDTNRKYYDVEENRVIIDNLTFTTNKIFNYPGTAKAYVLLVSEIP